MTVPEMPEDEFGADRGSPTNPTVGRVVVGVAMPGQAHGPSRTIKAIALGILDTLKFGLSFPSIHLISVL
jgi:hypothetical protein